MISSYIISITKKDGSVAYYGKNDDGTAGFSDNICLAKRMPYTKCLSTISFFSPPGQTADSGMVLNDNRGISIIFAENYYYQAAAIKKCLDGDPPPPEKYTRIDDE